jgi:hypothetical protein
MALRQYMVPGKGYANEVNANQFLVAGKGYLNSTSTVPYVFAYVKRLFISIF